VGVVLVELLTALVLLLPFAAKFCSAAALNNTISAATKNESFMGGIVSGALRQLEQGCYCGDRDTRGGTC